MGSDQFAAPVNRLEIDGLYLPPLFKRIFENITVKADGRIVNENVDPVFLGHDILHAFPVRLMIRDVEDVGVHFCSVFLEGVPDFCLAVDGGDCGPFP